MTNITPSFRFAGLDGLRAIAVAAVVIYHVIPGALPGGGLGVDIFFVLSGFLITGLLIGEHAGTGRIRLRAFWARRARRLVPALVLLIVVCCSAALVLGGDLLVGMGREVLGAATFSSNWLAIANGTSYFTGTTPEVFRNLWSLAVEEQFYLIWPFVALLVFLARKRGIRVLVFVVLAAASAAAMAILYVPHTDATRVYYGTDTHSFGLAIGAVLAVLTSKLPQTLLGWARWQRALLPIPGAVALVALLWLAVELPADGEVTFRGGLVVVAVLTAVTIWGSIIPGSILGRILDLAPLRWIGKRSYGIYLWHWPVIVILAAALPSWQNAFLTEWLIGGLAVGVTVGVAALSYRFVEEPIRRGGLRAWFDRGFGRGSLRPLRVFASIVSFTVLTALLGGTGLAVTTAPQVGGAQTDIAAGQAALLRSRLLPPPPAGSTGNSMIAIGDSVMLAATPALQKEFPGILIDAVVSRQMNKLPGILQAMADAHTLRSTLIIGLGTNGSIAASTLDRARAILGRDRQIVLVNIQAPRGWTPGVNQILRAYAARFDNVELANWHHDIAAHISILAPDQIHPGPTGGRIYAHAVRDALHRLAELPPYPQTDDFTRGGKVTLGGPTAH
jgi:peptidoglycan/LPS O-acetylase OafA/YrhL